MARLVGGVAGAGYLLILTGMRASATFRRQVCTRGKLGILNLGYEFCLATPDLPERRFTMQPRRTGYA